MLWHSGSDLPSQENVRILRWRVPAICRPGRPADHPAESETVFLLLRESRSVPLLGRHVKKSCVCPARLHKSCKDLPLIQTAPAHVLRVPLNAQAEGVIASFNRLRKTVLTDRGDGKTVADPVCGLVVKAVDVVFPAARNPGQKRTLRDSDTVDAAAA